MKKTLATILMMVCFAATFALETVKYERPENADVTTEGKWYIPVEIIREDTDGDGVWTEFEWHSMFATFDTNGSILKTVRVYSFSLDELTPSTHYEHIMAAFIPHIKLTLNTRNSVTVRYDIINSGKVVHSTEEYTFHETNINEVNTCELNDLNNIRYKSKKYQTLDVYEKVVKPFADALYVGNDIIFHIRDNNGNSESVYIEADGFGKTMGEL